MVGLDDPTLDSLRHLDPILLDADTGDLVYEACDGDAWSVLEGVRRPLHGSLLIVGNTEDGDDCEPKVRLKDVTDTIDFGTAVNGMFTGARIIRAIQ